MCDWGLRMPALTYGPGVAGLGKWMGWDGMDIEVNYSKWHGDHLWSRKPWLAIFKDMITTLAVTIYLCT